jgi:hypothetical protein
MRFLRDITPNWSTPPRATFEYRTLIFTARDGSEARRAARSTPRMTLEFSCLMERERMRRFRGIASRSRAELYGLPNYSAAPAYVASTVGSTVTLDSIPWWLAPGVDVAIVKGRISTSARVLFIVGQTITLNVTLDEQWNSDSLILPVVYGQLAASIPASLPTDDVATIDITLSVDPTTVAMPYQGHVSFLGREVLEMRPNWRQALQVGFEAEVDTVDFGHGRVSRFSPQEYNAEVTQSLYTLKGSDRLNRMLAFLQRARGRRGEFYCPTGTNDLILASDVPLGALSIPLKDGGLVFQDYGDSQFYRAVAVVRNSGVIEMFRIASVGIKTGGHSVINLSEPVTTPILRADVRRVSWAPICRLSSDSITIIYPALGIGEVVLSTTSLPFVPAENPESVFLIQYMIDTYGEDFTINGFADPLDLIVNHTYPSAAGTL